LVQRVRDNEDRRYLTVHLSEAGTVLISKVFADVEAEIVGEIMSLTEDEKILPGSLCKKLGMKGVIN